MWAFWFENKPSGNPDHKSHSDDLHCELVWPEAGWGYCFEFGFFGENIGVLD
jgi:hypothetical protein